MLHSCDGTLYGLPSNRTEYLHKYKWFHWLGDSPLNKIVIIRSKMLPNYVI